MKLFRSPCSPVSVPAKITWLEVINSEVMKYNYEIQRNRPGFSLGRLHMGGQVQGDKALMGVTREGGHRPYGGT